MGYRDLREWIVAVRELGELRDVRGATWQEDIGSVTEMLHHTDDSPAVLFDDIPGYAHGQRSLVNANARRRRLALTLGLPLERGSTHACSSTRRSHGSGASASPSPSAPTPRPSARRGNGGPDS